MKKICIVTGTRAEYGLLKSVIEKVNTSNKTISFMELVGGPLWVCTGVLALGHDPTEPLTSCPCWMVE